MNKTSENNVTKEDHLLSEDHIRMVKLHGEYKALQLEKTLVKCSVDLTLSPLLEAFDDGDKYDKRKQIK